MSRKKPLSSNCLSPKLMPLFPTMGSLDEVMSLGESMLPITTKNSLTTLLMTYHNTLLTQFQE